MRTEDKIVVGRQGIWDAHGGLVGYELLFRAIDTGPAGPDGRPNGDQMTAEVVFSALSIGLSRLAGDLDVFCNADRGVLVGKVPLLMPPGRTVVEVLENVIVDAAVEDGCHKLVAAGYRLALDDFTPGSKQEALLPVATDVKIDLLATPPGELADLAAHCRSYDVRLLAEKVENADELPRLRDLGFELFQGFALDRPAILEERTLTQGSAARVHAAVDVMGSAAGFDELEQLLLRDPALSHQVLLLASFGRLGETRRTVSSVRDALVLSGTNQVRAWLALLLARPQHLTAQSQDAFLATVVRARVCELLTAAKPAMGADPRLAFTAGMLSALDRLLDVPRSEIGAKLALSDELRGAAFDGQGALGRLVLDVTAYPDLDVTPTRSGVSVGELDAAFAAAFAWGAEAVGVLD